MRNQKGSAGFRQTCFDSKFHFRGIFLKKFGYCIYPRLSTPMVIDNKVFYFIRMSFIVTVHWLVVIASSFSASAMLLDCGIITKTRLFKYIENFTTKNRKKNQIKNYDIFHISAQNIDCGYSLEPPRRGSSNEYPQSIFFSKIRKIMSTPVNPSFTI